MKPATNPKQLKDVLFKTLGDILRHWWLMLAAGLLLIAVGIWVLCHPFRSYLTLSWIFAVGMMSAGVLDVIFAWNNRHSKRWIWWILAGIADIVVGAYLFNETLITIAFLPLVIGLWTFYKGFMAIGDAFHIRAYNFGNWRRLLFTAVVVLLMASLILLCPVIGIENIFLFSGLAFITAGLFRVYLSYKLFRIEQKIKDRSVKSDNAVS